MAGDRPFDPTKRHQGYGRRSKLDEELIERIKQFVLAGNYIEVACAAVGVDRTSYYRWIRIGGEVESKIVDTEDDEEVALQEVTEHEYMCYIFYYTMKQATAESEAFAVATVRKHMTTNWQAAMTYLERRYPGRWKRRDEVTVSNPFDVQGEVNASNDEASMLNDPEASRLMHAALERAAMAALNPGEPEIVDADVVEDTHPGSTED